MLIKKEIQKEATDNSKPVRETEIGQKFGRKTGCHSLDIKRRKCFKGVIKWVKFINIIYRSRSFIYFLYSSLCCECNHYLSTPVILDVLGTHDASLFLVMKQ